MATLKVRIVSPKQILFESEAFAVSSRNSVGNFDILPEHANFITLVEGFPITLRLSRGERQVFNFTLAIIHCTDGLVSIYTDIQSINLVLPPT